MLAAELHDLDDSSSLYPLAAGIRRVGEAQKRGDLILIAATLNGLAAELDGEALTEGEWDAVRNVAASLADLVTRGFTAAGLARLGASWSERTSPPLPN
ncbi:MAG: hypothetical protein JO290_06535 [Sphingomonadaceae bacterium]|nr:hypothetical protein [Sphingomonadaceae bacterium]